MFRQRNEPFLHLSLKTIGIGSGKTDKKEHTRKHKSPKNIVRKIHRHSIFRSFSLPKK